MNAARDVYANLLRDPRGLGREQSRAREAWFERLTSRDKEETLFELEMLMKGLTCFAPPLDRSLRRPSGKPGPEPPPAQDLRGELRVVHELLARALHCVRRLLGEPERASALARGLEAELPDDQVRHRRVEDPLTQDSPETSHSPERSLAVLRDAFTAFYDLTEGLLRLPHVSQRLFDGLLGTIQRELGRNTHFGPLVAFEFRPERDRIHHPEVIEALGAVGDAAHEVVAVSFLALFRGLRYVARIDAYASDPSTIRCAYATLAVFRGDLQALAVFFERHAATQLAEAFERQLFTVPAHALRQEYEVLLGEAGRLLALRRTLEALATALHVEVHTLDAHELPALAASPDPTSDAEPGARVALATAPLRGTLHYAIRALFAEVAPSVPPPTLASEAATRREASERLRRDVWMFSQVLRAFLAKATAATVDPDRWTSRASLRFASEFLHHFEHIGHQAVRASDDAHLDRFLGALESLRDVDLLDLPRLRSATEECASFHGVLEELFEAVSRRTELQGVPFDRRQAAETLKTYLSAGRTPTER